MPQDASEPTQGRIAVPPRGFALLLAVGPAIVWCAEFIGSGEVILATRTGAVLGTAVLWAVVVGIVLKYVIGLAGGWYTVTTGESMIDLFGRMPGPKNAVVWLVLVAQLLASVLAIGSIAASAGVFVAELVPITPFVAGWAVTLLAVAVAWVGEFKPLKLIMTGLVTLTLIGVVVVAVRVLPPLADLVAGLTPNVPAVPEWAIAQNVSTNAWAELLPLLGWGAGGFASQVWYTYWIMGAGYGATAGGRQGKPADEDTLRELTPEDADRLSGWRRAITFDATAAMVIGVLVTCGFLIVGAGVLGKAELAPDGPDVALTIATIFGADWGSLGATLFLVGGAAALLSTQMAQVAGWPYLLDDCVRLCLPSVVAGWSPIARRRVWLVFYLLTSMTIVFTLGYKPVQLVKTSAMLDGLLLTPIQAIVLLVGLYWVLPKLFAPEIGRRLQPGPAIGVGLGISFVVFSYFCLVQFPGVLRELLEASS
ncbi:MAG: Nramp family divalent metal transporter [Planctomycetota bacterium]